MKVSTNDFKTHYQLKSDECKLKCESCKATGDLETAKTHQDNAKNYDKAISKL